MITSTDNIVIVGGGSSGWITAAAIIRMFPHKNVTLIESPDVPTVGVGESTLGQFKQFCAFLNIDEIDFMRSTDASYKLSIRFTDFYQKDYGSFHYPFGEPFMHETIDGIHDWLYKKAMYPDTPVQDFVDCYFPAAALFNTNKYSLNLNNEFDNFNAKRDVAYHFDAIKFALWLREKYCKPRGVKHIQATVTDVKVNDDIGVEKLILNTGDEITADIFVDCTGFKSLLIGQHLKQEFISYSHILPNNRAWAAQVPYKNKELEMQGFTNCTAIENGWVWNTPVWTRLGTGYVYSDKFVDPETAKQEFKNYLMSNKMVIPRTQEEVDALKFKDVPMRIGSYKNTFVKNVVAIGLSAAFIEPLESNGLYTVHEWAMLFLRLLQRPVINEYDKVGYNHTTFTMWRGFADFVAMHYCMSARTDTEYWRDNFNRNVLKDYDSIFSGSVRASFLEHIDNHYRSRFGPPIDGRNYISVGMNVFPYDQVALNHKLLFNEWYRGNSAERKKFESKFKLFEQRKEKWRKNAEAAPTLYEYQKKHIYNEE